MPSMVIDYAIMVLMKLLVQLNPVYHEQDVEENTHKSAVL